MQHHSALAAGHFSGVWPNGFYEKLSLTRLVAGNATAVLYATSWPVFLASLRCRILPIGGMIWMRQSRNRGALFNCFCTEHHTTERV